MSCIQIGEGGRRGTILHTHPDIEINNNNDVLNISIIKKLNINTEVNFNLYIANISFPVVLPSPLSFLVHFFCCVDTSPRLICFVRSSFLFLHFCFVWF